MYNLHPTNKKCLILILLANIYCILCSRNYVSHMRYTSKQKSPLHVFKLLGQALKHLSLLHLLYIRLSCTYSFANMYHLFIKHIYVDCFHCADTLLGSQDKPVNKDPPSENLSSRKGACNKH